MRSISLLSSAHTTKKTRVITQLRRRYPGYWVYNRRDQCWERYIDDPKRCQMYLPVDTVRAYFSSLDGSGRLHIYRFEDMRLADVY